MLLLNREEVAAADLLAVVLLPDECERDEGDHDLVGRELLLLERDAEVDGEHEDYRKEVLKEVIRDDEYDVDDHHDAADEVDVEERVGAEVEATHEVWHGDRKEDVIIGDDESGHALADLEDDHDL